MSDEGDLRLVPYASQPREVVLRRGNTVVRYNEDAQSIELGSVSSSSDDETVPDRCPTCQRPFDTFTNDGTRTANHGTGQDDYYMNAEYFQLLERSRLASAVPSRSPSPQRRLTAGGVVHRASGGSTTPSPRATRSSTQQIPIESFSQGYFKTFFVEDRELGRGGNGVVLLVRHMINDVDLGQFACKRVPVGDNAEWLRKVLLEVQLLQNLSHKNLVKYNHVWLENMQISTFAPAVPCAFILQQYCNSGDLHDYMFGLNETITKEQMKNRARRASRGDRPDLKPLRSARHLSFEEIFAFFRDITSGLNYLHRSGYVHRDLKPSNCLLHKTGDHIRVLVSDFGEMQDVNNSRKSTGNTGTISFCAPEVLKLSSTGHLGQFTAKSDVFSLGLIVHLMCFSRLPYNNADVLTEENDDIDKLRAEISAWPGLGADKRARPDLPDKLYRFLSILLSSDPENRPNTDEILQSIRAGTPLYEHASSAGLPTSPTTERKESLRPWSIPGVSASAESTSAGDVRRRPSALVTRQPTDRTLMTLSARTPTITTPLIEVPPRSRRPSYTAPPRLLPAPPPPPRSFWVRTSHLLTRNHPPWPLRAALLCFKIWLCWSICAPQAVRIWLLVPLVMLAVWDGGEGTRSYGVEVGTMVMHVGIVKVCGWAGWFCM